MKTLKSLLMLCAGLSFCACSSDNEPQLPEGKGAVTVRIVNPTATRAIGETAENSIINGDVYMWLTHDGDDQSASFTYDKVNDKYTFDRLGEGQATAAEYVNTTNDGEWTSFRFYNIGTPTALTVSFNGGDADGLQEDDVIEELQDPTAVPIWTMADEFTKTDRVVDKDGNAYQEWECWVSGFEIPLARLEVQLTSGDFVGFDYVAIAGAYLDDIYPTGGADETTNYYLQYDPSISKVGAGNAILCDNFMTAEGTLSNDALVLVGETEGTQTKIADAGTIPATGEYFGYNIYPGDVPLFKLCLKVQKEGSAQYYWQYAIIDEYKEGQTTLTEFEPGYIYRVTGLELNGTNIQVNEEPEEMDYSLVATVVKAKWETKDVNGSWAQ